MHVEISNWYNLIETVMTNRKSRRKPMNATPDLAAVAALIADPSRAAMLAVLLGGVSLPAGELAAHAKISPQTASTHLAKLVEGGLLAVRSSGRHRYFYLSNPQVAQALETLALIAPAPKVRNLSHSLEMEAVRRARTCYNHLAGELGVALAQAFIDKGFLYPYEEAYEVTAPGQEWFNRLGIEGRPLPKKLQNFAKVCLDWSERKPHLGGSLGAALARQLFERDWIVRVEGSRAVKVTERGQLQLQTELGLNLNH
jgi:DNA-binding transcriptional ArsR family regulator